MSGAEEEIRAMLSEASDGVLFTYGVLAAVPQKKAEERIKARRLKRLVKEEYARRGILLSETPEQ